MFDLSLAHIHGAERERDLAADLRDRRILKATDGGAGEPVASRRPVAPRTAARVRALGR